MVGEPIVDVTLVLQEMDRLFFDISSNGSLVYNNPLLGAFEIEKLGLRICVDLEALSLLVERYGRKVARFEHGPGVGQALKNATRCYWRVVQDAGQLARSKAMQSLGTPVPARRDRQAGPNHGNTFDGAARPVDGETLTVADYRHSSAPW